MKKYFLFLTMAIVITSSASASFSINNASLDLEYGPGDTINGWVNLSLTDQNANSVITAFDSQITLIEFLENNSADYSCFPTDCQTDYTEFNKEEEKTYPTNPGDKKLLGIKITGDISSIDSFSMKINSDAGEEGTPQFFIDLLNDDSIDWHPYSFSGNYGDKVYGCYNDQEPSELAEITRTEYCEKIEIPLCSKVKIGALIEEIAGKGGEVDFNMRIYNDEGGKSCTASASGTGEISCETDMQVKKAGEFFVCISTENYEDNNKYSIKYEQNNPCGFSNKGEYEYDFPIFIQTGTYSPVGEVILNDQEIEDFGQTPAVYQIEDYIDERYNNNCQEGCMIPIKLISGAQQTINISNIQLSYTSGISKTERYLNELTEEPAKVNMDSQILDLKKTDISVPNSYGTRIFSLKIDGDEILRRDIEVLKLGTINSITPLEVAAAVPVRFTVSASGNITEYIWNFGDGTEITTKDNFTYHTYQETGNYELKLSVVNENGKALKTVTIRVKTPKQEIKDSLQEKKESLENIKTTLTGLNNWVRSEIEKELNLETIESDLNNIETRYNNAGSDDYVSIMTSLYEVEVPQEIQKIETQGDFLPFPENVNPRHLTKFGYQEDNPEEYSESIIIWMASNLRIQLKSTIFILKYEEQNTPLFTYENLEINPTEVFEEAYMIIEGEPNFKEDYGQEEISGITGIKLKELEERKTLEFILPGKIEPTELTLYISPDFSELPTQPQPGICDNDRICEEENGETQENCDDCHETEWWKAGLGWILLTIITFVIYIILQEWYKKRYEKHLFKSKEDLYNLMNFIYNALKKGVDKKIIYSKLKEYEWKREQIVYAFKKLLGKRTGMWEIPIFKHFEKKKIQKELMKRQNQNTQKNLQKV